MTDKINPCYLYVCFTALAFDFKGTPWRTAAKFTNAILLTYSTNALSHCGVCPQGRLESLSLGGLGVRQYRFVALLDNLREIFL